MTNDEMRVAIAKACGWEFHPENGPLDFPYWHRLTKQRASSATLPDYPNDLNAMHEAEKMITDDQWATYRDHLNEMVFQEIKDRKPLPRWYRRESCTSAQRAEAFLRTLGLWKGA